MNLVDPDGEGWYLAGDEDDIHSYYYDENVYSQDDMDNLGIMSA